MKKPKKKKLSETQKAWIESQRSKKAILNGETFRAQQNNYGKRYSRGG